MVRRRQPTRRRHRRRRPAHAGRRRGRGLRLARWRPVTDGILGGACSALAAAAPPICLAGDPDATVAGIHAALVDGLARDRLVAQRWYPDLAPDRQPSTSAARAVFKALANADPIVRGRTAPHLEAVDALAAALDRHHRRALGEPVVLPRLRLVVPDDPFDAWEVAIEVVDELDPGRWCTADDVWRATPLAIELAGHEDHVDALAETIVETAQRVGEAVDVLAELTGATEPTAVQLDVEGADLFLEQAPAELARLGVELIGPERLLRADVEVRGRATAAPASDRAAGFGRDAIVEWAMVVADDDGPAALSAAELARAERAGATLLHTGRRWVRIDPAALRRARRRLDEHRREHVRVDAITLLRLAGEAEITAAGRGWTDELLGGLPDERLVETRRVGRVRRRAAALPAARARVVPLPRTARPRRVPGRRHGARQDGHRARPPARSARPAPGRLPALGRAQLGVGGCPLHTVAAGRRPPRRRSGSRGDGAVDDTDLAAPMWSSPRTGCCPATSPTSPPSSGPRVVLDEAQMIKNPATHAARAARLLRAGQKLALTGTPVENRLAELWAILDTVNPGMLGSREQFRHRFGKPIERNGDADAAARLRRITQPFVLRRSKADRQLVPDLPDKIEQVAWAGLTREQAVLYQHVVDQLLADAAATTGMKRRGLVLAALTRLKQICNHPAHVLGDGSRLAGRSGQARPVRRADRRAARHRRTGASCSPSSARWASCCGATPPSGCSCGCRSSTAASRRARRDAMVAGFQAGEGPPLLLVSLRAGGTGLNLTAAGQVIHYDRWWNPAVEDQATDRAWRIGQSRTVVVHKLVCEGTVEERIAALIDEKRALADSVVGSGEAWLSELSTAELRELVRLDHGADR